MPKIDLEKDVRACLEESRLGPTNAFENALAVIELLWNAQCCSRCCLRFVDCPKNSLYLEPESVACPTHFVFFLSSMNFAKCPL